MRGKEQFRQLVDELMSAGPGCQGSDDMTSVITIMEGFQGVSATALAGNVGGSEHIAAAAVLFAARLAVVSAMKNLQIGKEGFSMDEMNLGLAEISDAFQDSVEQIENQFRAKELYNRKVNGANDSANT